MSQMEEVPYPTPKISEEEFVYDLLRNRLLYPILQEGSFKFFGTTEDNDDELDLPSPTKNRKPSSSRPDQGQ